MVIKTLESIGIQAILLFLYFFSIFLPESWILGNAEGDDDNLILSVVLLVIFGIFMIEICILSIFKGKFYLNASYGYMWLEVVSHGVLSYYCVISSPNVSFPHLQW